MKKLLVVLLSLLMMQTAFAYDASNIKIKVSGAIHDNRYFLCMSGVGCLSMMAAKQGTVFPILSQVKMRNIYVMDAANNMQLTPQGLPSSCNVTVKKNQTITISGHLTPGAHKGTELSQLRCSVSG